MTTTALDVQGAELLLLIQGLTKQKPYKLVVFFVTARLTQLYSEAFGVLGMPVLEMHSRRSQSQRTKVADQVEAPLLHTPSPHHTHASTRPPPQHTPSARRSRARRAFAPVFVMFSSHSHPLFTRSSVTVTTHSHSHPPSHTLQTKTAQFRDGDNTLPFTPFHFHRPHAHSQFRDCDNIVMFSSDVSARGMDYPDVTAVIQVC